MPARDPDAWMARVLVDVADAISGPRSSREVLQVIVDRGAEAAGDVGALAFLAPGGAVRGIVASGHGTSLDGLAAAGDGPAVECLATGRPVNADDLDQAGPRWPAFVGVARTTGVRSAYAAPMRRHHVVCGVLLVVADGTFGLDRRHRTWCQGLADVAAIVARPAPPAARAGLEAVERRLARRTAVERAVGVLAEQGGVSPDEARRSLHHCAAAHDHDLVDLAVGVIDGDFDFADVTAS